MGASGSGPKVDPKAHARFLEYKERHVYFGRGDLKMALDLSTFAALDAEREALAKLTLGELGSERHARLGELTRLLLLD